MHGLFGLTGLDEDVAIDLVEIHRARIDLKTLAQRLERLCVEAHPPERVRVGERLRDELAGVGLRLGRRFFLEVPVSVPVHAGVSAVGVGGGVLLPALGVALLGVALLGVALLG